MSFDERANKVVWLLLAILAIGLFAHFSTGCAWNHYEVRNAAGEKILDVSSINIFSGEALVSRDVYDASGDLRETYTSTIDRDGISDNGLEAIKSKPVSSAATAIGKAATGTSALPSVNIGGD